MGNILCCIKPRDGDELQSPYDKNKSEKKSSNRRDITSGKEYEEGNGNYYKKNKHKNLKNHIQEEPSKNFIDANFDTFNANYVPNKKTNLQQNNNKNSNLQNINEEEDEIDFDGEIKNYGKAKATNIDKNKLSQNTGNNMDKNKNINNNIKSPEKKNQKNKGFNNDNHRDKEEIQYTCDDEKLNSDFSKKTMERLNSSQCSDSNSVDKSSKKNKKTDNIIKRQSINNKVITDFSQKNKDENIYDSINKNFNSAYKIFENKTFRLEVFIESFYLNGIDTDNFGPHFLPYLEILLGDLPAEDLNFNKDQDNSKLDISNNSNISDLDISVNMNQSYINNSKNNSAKNYLLRHYKSYMINSKNFYESDTNLIFTLKNGLIFKKSDNKNNSNIPIITIGSESINLGKFYRKNKEEIFDGFLELKLRKSNIIGRLNITILISEEKNINKVNLEEQSAFFEKFIKSKKIEEFDDLLSQKSFKKDENKWNNFFLDSDEITNDITMDFFLSEENKGNPIKVRNSFIKITQKEIHQKINRNNDNDEFINKLIFINEVTGEPITEENLQEMFVIECMKKRNKFAFFQLLYIFLNYFQNGEFEIFDKFLSLLDETEIQFFVEVSNFDDKNLFIFKYYLIVIDGYILFHKNNQNQEIRENQIINQDILLRNVFTLLQILKGFEKTNDKLFKKYIGFYKECLILSFNIIWDLCHEPDELLIKDSSSRKSKQNSRENKKKETTMVYKNCLITSTYRNLIVYLLNNFINDSEVSGMIFKILRKSFQILNKDTILNNIDLNVLSETPDKIYEQLIQGILFNDSNNFFLNATKLAMGKFNHFPELQNNILHCLFCIVNKCNTNSIKKFLDVFDIETFNSHLDIYRCKLRFHAKEINNYHLNILYLITSNLVRQDSPENKEKLNLIAKSIASFFDKNNKRYQDFTNRKFWEIQIQDTLLKMVNHLSKIKECCNILLKSDFINDFFSYLNNFLCRKSDTKSERSTASLKYKDYLLYVCEKKKRRINIETIKKYCFSILNSSCNIVLNFALQENTIFDEFATVLHNFNIGNSDALIELLEDCIRVLDNYQVKTDDLHSTLNKIRDNFGDEDQEEQEAND